MARMSNDAIRDKGIILSLDLDLKDFNKKITQVGKVTRELEKQLKKVDKALKLDPKNTDLITSKTKLLEKEQKELVKNLNEFSTGLNELKARGVDETDERFVRLSTEIANTKNRIKEVREQLALMSVYKITQPVDDFADSMEKASRATKELADEFKVLSGVAAAALGVATKSAIDFEEAFASVKKTVDETANISYADLSDSIRQLSKEVPTSASDIAEVVALAGQLGIATEDVIKFSKSMIDLGNSTNLSATEAAETLAKFINVTGSSADDIDKLGSTLVALGNNAATTESDIVELAFRLSGAAVSVGFTEQEIFALSTALSSAGLKAEAAGGSISTVLQNIQKEVSGTKWEDANKELAVWGKLIGMTGEQFKKAWSKDTYATFQKVINGLGTYADNGGDLITKLASLNIETIRQTDSMSRLVLASENLNKYTELANKAYADGNALQTEAAKRYETTASQLQILENILQDIGIELGNALLPKVNKLIKAAQKWAKKAQAWVGKNQELITTLLTFTASIAPVLTGISAFQGMMAKGAKSVSELIKFIAKLSSGTTTLSGAILTGSVPALGVLIGVLGTAAIAYKALHTEAAQNILDTANQRKELEESNRISEERYALIRENIGTQLAELDYYGRLAEELDVLTDENGDVLEGYEARVDFIKNELVEAGLIEEGSLDAVKGKYNEVIDAVKNSVEAKRAATIYEGTFEKETQALNDQAEAVDWLKENYDKYGESLAIVDKYQGIITDGHTDLSLAEQMAYKNAQDFLAIYDEMQARFDDSNAILDNINAMREAYESGDYETVINDFFLAEQGLITKGTDEIKVLLDEKYTEIENMKVLDDGSPFFQATIENTEKEFSAMAESIGLDVERAYGYYEALKRLNNDIQNMAGSISSTVARSNSIVRNGSRGAFQSGGYGFQSGGFTSNVTINVSNNGRDITATDVRKWANVINEQLGGSF